MADDARDAEVGSWLEVEPLDDVTRRRLVATAMRESEEGGGAEAPEPVHRLHGWRWIAVAAAVVVVLVGGLALLTANGGHDEQRATGTHPRALAPQVAAAAPAVGDFGDLDRPANLAALRAALEHPPAAASGAPTAPESASDATGSTPPRRSTGCLTGVVGTVLAQGTGTLDGRPVTVVLTEGTGGTRSFDALFQGSCDVRHLP